MRALEATRRFSRALFTSTSAYSRSSPCLLPSPDCHRNIADANGDKCLLRFPWSVSQQRGVKVNASQVRPGNVIEKTGKFYQVIEAEHKMRGRGGAMMQMELRDVDTGNKVSLRFGTEEAVEKGMKVSLELFDGRPLSASLPKRVTCAIKEIHASTKGPAVTPRYQRAVLDNGVTVLVPSYLEIGEEIFINPEDDSYIGRAK
ncbi:elongation factor P isoform X3 [Mangifera indica]|uniref:elongation factor P isoform X3 n=1 Tax=Mangifera indica TaxID=29780 RepID=UPI001CFB2521|nr:elongation factor P isoform X3 [Mangifera indica]